MPLLHKQPETAAAAASINSAFIGCLALLEMDFRHSYLVTITFFSKLKNLQTAGWLKLLAVAVEFA